MKKEYDIFISYRREGGKEHARNLTSELVSRGFHPFLDFDELKDGKFDKRITDAIESAPVFIFILSPGSLDRCVNEDDWVRKEILHAIEHKRHIVPVDIDKQFETFPSAENFPLEIKNALGQHQFSQIQTETLYKVSIDEMVKNRIQPAIDEYMREKQKAAGMTGAEIHIETDMDCHVQRFHKDMIVAKVDEENVIHLPKGKHKLQFIAVSNPNVVESVEYKVEDITNSDYIEIALKEKAGIVEEETRKIDILEHERDVLQSRLRELKVQIQAIEDEKTENEENLRSQIDSLKESESKLTTSVHKLESLVKDKDALLESCKAELDSVATQCEKLRIELANYKDYEQKEQQAKEEAERIAQELSNNRKRPPISHRSVRKYLWEELMSQGKYEKALFCLLIDAERDDAYALWFLANQFYQKNVKMAEYFARRGTTLNYDYCQRLLGKVLRETHRKQEALECFIKSGGRFSDSAFYAGEMYERGEGTPKNIEQAVYWYRVSVKNGEYNAKRALDRLGYPEYKEGEYWEIVISKKGRLFKVDDKYSHNVEWRWRSKRAPEDLAEILHYAEQGNVEAQKDLGHILVSHEARELGFFNRERSRYWLEKAGIEDVVENLIEFHQKPSRTSILKRIFGKKD